MKRSFKISGRILDESSPPYITAEIGVNHNGDLELARKTIDAAAQSGADAVKFQTFRAEEFMSDRDLTYEYESGGHRVDESMYGMFKRLELPYQWHRELRDYAHSKDLEFLSSGADPASVDLLISLGVPALKAASEDLINLPLLKYIAGKEVPVILSTGMADEDEIERALATLKNNGCSDILLLHCVSLYPAPDEELNLRRMVSLRDKYGLPVGYSDHSLGVEAAVAAAAMGAVFIEKHFTLNRSLSGPDHSFSADPDELSELVRGVRRVHRQLGSPDIAPSESEAAARLQFRRSIVAAVDITAGEAIDREMLCLKRPGGGIQPHEMESLIGRRALRDFSQDEQIVWDELK